MSDQAQGPGWWQASDGRFYPPESHPNYRPPPPPPQGAPPPPTGVPLGAAQPALEVKGHNGTVTFDGRFVTITRKGALARMTVGKGEKRIPVKSIAAVQWKPAGAMVNGFIQFTVPGGNERKSKPGSSTQDAARDENSVLFTKSQAAAFQQLRDAIEDAIA